MIRGLVLLGLAAIVSIVAWAGLARMGAVTGTIAAPSAGRRPSASVAASTGQAPSSASPAPEEPTVAELIGQKLVVRMDGTTPSEALLGRIRRGEVGGIILLAGNITGPQQLRQLTTTLHAAATAGGQPRLLIAVDQEGGSVARVPWAPPSLGPAAMAATGSIAIAREQGVRTGAALRDLGIDVDLAPVADVPSSEDGFLVPAGRTWSADPDLTARLTVAFADGLRDASVIPAFKHFPGLGRATDNTDRRVVSIHATRAALAPSLVPFERAIESGMPLIMLSNATYPAWDEVHAAGWSPAIGSSLLRGSLGFTGVTITDSLDGTAHARGVPTRSLALLAARAGTDLILTTGSEATTAGVFRALVDAATAGRLSVADLRTSYDRIQGLKTGP